jgi:hypothetical protein
VCNFDLGYDPQSVTTVTGTVLTTINYNPGNPMLGPQAVIVSSENQVYTVFLGPGWFMNQTGLKFKAGDSITVTGSLRCVAGSTYLVASTITTPKGSFAIRNATGMPLWSEAPVVVTPPPFGRGPITALLVPFDSNRIVTESGRIKSVYEVQTAEDTVPEMVAVIQPPAAFSHQVSVLLGPRALLDQAGLILQPGQYLWARGSSVRIDNQRYLVATRVVQGTATLDLRTLTGIPLWTPGVQVVPAGPCPPIGAGPCAPAETTTSAPMVIPPPPTTCVQ